MYTHSINVSNKKQEYNFNGVEPLVSFIIPCYKEPLWQFKMAIDSVINQTYKKLEIIIILDNPLNIELEKAAKEYVKQDGRIVFYKNENNLGLVGTLNKAIKLAQGELIARLDSDDYAKPERITEQLKYFPKYDIVSSDFAFINADNHVVRHRKFPNLDKNIKNHLINIEDCMYHVTWLVKKEVFYQLGFYRDIGPFEDYDFLLRACRMQLKLYNFPNELTMYRISVNGISSSNNIRQHLGSEYLREHYLNIENITRQDIDNYLASETGKRHAEEYKNFYKYKEKIMASKSKAIYYIRLLLYGGYLTVTNYYGRKKFLIMVRTILKV